MLNAVGLQNPGVESVINDELPRLAECFDKPVMANVSGFSVDDYVYTVSRLDPQKQIGWFEVNISCPNVHGGGMSFGVDPASAEKVTSAVRKVTKKPVIMKLSPNVTDIAGIARACEAARRRRNQPDKHPPRNAHRYKKAQTGHCKHIRRAFRPRGFSGGITDGVAGIPCGKPSDNRYGRCFFGGGCDRNDACRGNSRRNRSGKPCLSVCLPGYCRGSPGGHGKIRDQIIFVILQEERTMGKDVIIACDFPDGERTHWVS